MTETLSVSLGDQALYPRALSSYNTRENVLYIIIKVITILEDQRLLLTGRIRGHFIEQHLIYALSDQ